MMKTTYILLRMSSDKKNEQHRSFCKYCKLVVNSYFYKILNIRLLGTKNATLKASKN